MGSRTPRGGGSIAGFRPEGGGRLQGFRIFGREAPKTAPSASFRALRARKSENPAIETPSVQNPAIETPLETKFCNRTPPQGVRDPIISSAWTPKRARTGSYASLLRVGSLFNFRL